MKKLLLVLTLLSMSSIASAGWLPDLSTTVQEVKEVKVYKLKSAGFSNLRVYEWTPLENPNIRCVFVAGSKKGGTACYPISKQ